MILTNKHGNIIDCLNLNVLPNMGSKYNTWDKFGESFINESHTELFVDSSILGCSLIYFYYGNLWFSTEFRNINYMINNKLSILSLSPYEVENEIDPSKVWIKTPKETTFYLLKQGYKVINKEKLNKSDALNLVNKYRSLGFYVKMKHTFGEPQGCYSVWIREKN